MDKILEKETIYKIKRVLIRHPYCETRKINNQNRIDALIINKKLNGIRTNNEAGMISAIHSQHRYTKWRTYVKVIKSIDYIL